MLLLLAVYATGIGFVGWLGGATILEMSSSFEIGVVTTKTRLDAATQARLSTMAMDRALYQLISASDAAEIRKAAIAAIKGASLLDESLQSLEQALPDDAKVKELVQLNQQIKPLRMAVIIAGKGNDDALAIQRLNEIHEPVGRIEQLSTDILNAEQSYLEQLSSSNATQGQARVRMLAIASIITVSVIFLLSMVLRQMLTRPLSTMEKAMSNLAAGNIDIKIEEEGNDEVGRTLRACRSTVDNLNVMVSSISCASVGTSRYAGELERMAGRISKIGRDLETTTRNVKSGSRSVLAATPETSTNVQVLRDETEKVLTEARHNLSSMEQIVQQYLAFEERMDLTIQQSKDLLESIQTIAGLTRSITGISSEIEQLSSRASNQTDKSITLAHEAMNKARNGQNTVGLMFDAIGQITTQSHQIADIANVIDGISFQTNILALNAAIEAARAGDSGKGFAVVASEVRNLAHRSAESAKQIRMLITDTVRQIDQGNALASEALHAMEQIGTAVHSLSLIIDQPGNGAPSQNQPVEGAESFSQLSVNIRELADRSRLASQRIAELTSEVQTTAQQTVSAMDISGQESAQNAQALVGISHGIRSAVSHALDMETRISEIDTQMQLQKSAVDAIGNSVSELENVTTESIGEAEELHLQSSRLSVSAVQLETEVGKFKFRAA